MARGTSSGGACPDNCTCGRHRPQSYAIRGLSLAPKSPGKSSTDDLRRGQCVASSDEDPKQQCPRGVRNMKQMLCTMHYARFQRHGSTEYIGNFGRPPKSKEQYAMIAAKCRSRKEELDRSKLARCMCGCIKDSHNRTREGFIHGCLEPGCKCKKFSEVNKLLYEEKAFKIAKLGFIYHIDEEAVCAACRQKVRIGTWFNAFSIKRAALHKYKECVAIRKRSLAVS